MAVELHTTDRGKDLLIVDGYTYYEKRKLKSHEIVWQCSTEKKCTAKVYTLANKKTISRSDTVHIHEKDEEKVQKKVLNASAKRIAEYVLEKPSKIIHLAISENPTSLENLTTRDAANLRKNIYRMRRKQMLSLPTNKEVAIEKFLDNELKTVKGEDFNLHADAESGLEIFSCNSNLQALKTSSLIIEGKTKKILEIVGDADNVLMVSKDRITAGDGVKAHDMEGKAVISTATTAKIFEYLNEVGIKTHYVRQHDERSLIVSKCDMIPIEWVSRRHATGSFLKRNPGVKEGFRFSPLKLETFFKDDENHDPQWSDEQLICAELVVGGLKIGRNEVEIMHKTTACIFEVLEKAWAHLGCSLIDMKVEYGVNQKGELVLADVIDSDSWRLWPSGDKRLMVDKQVYRNLSVVTAEDLEKVKRNFQWVAEKVKEFLPSPKIQVVILMGSPSDTAFCTKIQDACKKFGVPAFMRVTSAHKGPDETLNIIAQYEGSGQPTIFVAVAGRSNGLGPVTSGNSAFPVINCPPLTADWGREDIWSSLRLPSGLGCTTVISPEGAALAAAQMIALTDHVIWSRLKAQQLNRWIDLKHGDAKITA